jgi:serine/threonine-protein kinase PRP4
MATIEREEKEEKEEDEEDLFDMFNEDNNINDIKEKTKIDKERLEWDDEENYYKTMAGELLHDRYKVISQLGKGVFSSVVKVVDQ